MADTAAVDEPVFTVREVAAIFRVNITTVHRWINRNKLAAYKLPVGNSLRIPQREIDRIRSGDTPPDIEPPADLFPDVEPSIPQASSPTEQRAAAWKGVQEALTQKIVTPPQVVRWLKENHDVTMGEDILTRDEPPASISTRVLESLHDGLSELQLRLETPAG